ncbi:hypothetical protein LCGC14_2066040 [marine sediment metagenome]|uniref:Methyltransferase type 11 domain-containing protein n=1 Tax=marine sediment metagenome TaxID=412755 RepID=A0A0F9EJQ9_9ZZZZ
MSRLKQIQNTWFECDGKSKVEASNKLVWGLKDELDLSAVANDFLSVAESFGIYFANKTVLDVGCGYGRITKQLKRRNAIAIGVDINRSMASLFSAYVNTKLFLPYDGISLPIRSESVDIVTSSLVFKHIPREYLYLLWKEIYRILKRDGLLVFDITNLYCLSARDYEISFVEPAVKNYQQHVVHYYSSEELRVVLEQFIGFRVHWMFPHDGKRILSQFDHKPYQWYVIASKT